MTTLADDIVTLQSYREAAGFTHEQHTLDRVLAILAPLASLSPEQVAYLVLANCNAESDLRAFSPRHADAHAAMAKMLEAARG